MKSSSLQSKTVRPGFGSYPFYNYTSSRRPAAAKKSKTSKAALAKKKAQRRKLTFRATLLVAVILVAVLGIGFKTDAFKSPAPAVHHKAAAVKKAIAPKPKPTPAPAAAPAPAPVAAAVEQGVCAGNGLSELVVISISQRHLWACHAGAIVYDSPVVTGMENLAADLTPTGTYHIYGKETDVTLAGSDSTGSWDDPVSYWMPFLHNQYGSYGFHDATWRADSDFGNISPDSSNASHGCVELPLATAKWLYGWSYIGTTVSIQS